jgi:putative transcriptional regulator
MEASGDMTNLSGKLLVAMPGMGDTRFEKSVVFLCAHSDAGSMGLIVNKPSVEMKFDELLKQLSINIVPGIVVPDVHFGGPVEIGRGFVLHSSEYGTKETTMQIDDCFAMTATLDVLEDLAQGQGPERVLLALGYAGWGPGQLEAEIGQNGWLTCDASPEVVFAKSNRSKWEAALKTLGVDPLLLSATAGRA